MKVREVIGEMIGESKRGYRWNDRLSGREVIGEVREVIGEA